MEVFAPAMDHTRAFVDGDFPQELMQIIFLLLDGHDLLAAAEANPVWSSVIEKGHLWLKKTQMQWPYLFNSKCPQDTWSWKGYRIGPDHLHSEYRFLTTPHTSWRRYFLERRLTEALASGTLSSPNEDFIKGLKWTGPFIEGCEGDLYAIVNVEERVTLPNIRQLSYTARKKNQCSSVLDKLKDSTDVFGPMLSTIALRDNQLTCDDISPLLRGLVLRRPALTSLDLSGNSLNAAGAVSLAKILECDHHLLSLDLSSNEIGDEGSAALARTLRRNTSITHLSVSHNNIGKDGVIALAQALRWNVDGHDAGNVSPLQDRSPSVLLTPRTEPAPGSRASRASSRRRTAVPSRGVLNPQPLDGDIVPNGHKSPRESSASNHTLTSLDISNNPVGRVGIEALALSLQSNSSIGRLNLRYVGLPGNTQENIFAGKIPLPPFLACPSLTRLDISFNDMVSTSSENPEAILEGLRDNSTLTYLDMQRTCIGGWRRAFAIGRGLCLNTCLSEINLGYNWIGAGGNNVIVTEYANAIRNSKILLKVGLAHNMLGASASMMLVKAALVGSVEYLDLQYNDIGQAGVISIIATLEESNRSSTSDRCCFARHTPSDCLLLDTVLEENVPSGGLEHRRPLQVNLCGNVHLHELVSVSGASYAPGSSSQVPEPWEPQNDPDSGDTQVHFSAKRRKLDRKETVLVFEHDRFKKRRLPSPSYMEVQTKGVNSYCRSILNDWLMDLADAFLLPDEALFRAVHYADLYLSAVNVMRTKYQLVGAVALMIATNNFFSKLGMTDRTVSSPNNALLPRDIVYYSDDSYTQDEVMALEASMLEYMSFDLEYHSSLCYLTQYCASVQVDDMTASIALEICRQSTKEYSLLRLHPALVAACALYLAMRQSQLPWPDVLIEQTGLSTRCLAGCDEYFKFVKGKELKCKSILDKKHMQMMPQMSPKYTVVLS